MKKFNTVPITLVTGYLGSGKTTFINHVLKNAKGHKMAVIVNDIGEVNIDAELIEKGGVVSSQDNNLVALSNGCICCTLKKDLINQLAELVNSGKFDHILIEASGICEPVPIAQTICYMEDEFERKHLPKFYHLDAIVSVTDALRLKDEFGCGQVLNETVRGEEDIENLVIQQVEFCDYIILNKVSEVSSDELIKVKKIIRGIQPHAEIIETDYCNVDIDTIIDTNAFDFQKAVSSAAWNEAFESSENEHIDDDDDDKEEEEHDHEHEHHHDHEELEHHHHHHHHHEHGVEENDDEGTAEEYDIGTYVYFRRKPFDREKFIEWTKKDYGRMLIRSKGICYFSDETDVAYLYEQAGRQKVFNPYGRWFSVSCTERELKALLKNDANFRSLWDEECQDKIVKLVFIGQNIDKKRIKEELDSF